MSGPDFRRSRNIVTAGALVLVPALWLVPAKANTQESYSRGQNVSPAFEGWEENEDGSFSFLFGYMNRNWLEELDVPVGPNNNISPGPADQGQPTHLLPRRNRFVFKVTVPDDWGEKEMIWTLTTRGKTEYAYASLRTDYKVDNMVIASETGSLGAGASTPESRANVPPHVRLIGESVRRASVGQPVTLVAEVTDDGLPRARRRRPPRDPEATPRLPAASLRPPTRITVGKANGLNLAWFVYRGDGSVRIDPLQVKVWEDTRAAANSPWAPLWFPPELPEDGLWQAEVTFDRPGTYVLRARADDGGLYHDVDVTIIVAPISQQ
ncbi:MAG: hypothetical protein VYD78_06650 [Gemmatimonadota bacterium]|uniref:Uncharacterized protein n=1 Tax=marine metagenome TaxID=408172 RepID=A0A381Z5U9_9ZZZZ|nr:hypothetical protein [Gemmatimonadota bacterium]